MSTASTLTSRLLAACRLAYEVQREGSLPPGPTSALAGLAGPVTTLVGGFEGMDAAFVGTSDDGVVVAFRGTLPPDSPNHRQTVRDWLNDLEATLVPASWPLDGMVHAGFLRSLDALWPGLRDAVADARSRAPGKPVLVTGHSKGGALAHLCAHRLVSDPAAGLGAGDVVACTFAAPHAGNEKFRLAYELAVRSITRYEYADDVVPHLPPTLAVRHAFQDLDLFEALRQDLDYAAAGDLRFIDWDGHVVDDAPPLRAKRTFRLVQLLWEGGFDRLVADHSIADGSGYATAVGLQAG